MTSHCCSVGVDGLSGVAFVYPGQGSQRVGMGRWFYQMYGGAREIFDVASEVVGRDMARLCFRGPLQELKQTGNAQPALFTCNAAAEAVLHEYGVFPRIVSGHSVGEFNALAAAGVVSFREGLELVVARASLMQQLPMGGAMGSIVGLDEDIVAQICRDAEAAGPIGIALYNGPKSYVVSGVAEAVARCLSAAVVHGAKLAHPLQTSHAFHSVLMADAVEEWAEVVRRTRLSTPRIAIAFNDTGSVKKETGDIRDALIGELIGPVRWRECIETLKDAGARVIVEAGASRGLCSLNRHIAPDLRHVSMNDPEIVRELAGGVVGDS